MATPFFAFFASLSPRAAELVHAYLDGDCDALPDMIEELTSLHGASMIASGHIDPSDEMLKQSLRRDHDQPFARYGAKVAKEPSNNYKETCVNMFRYADNLIQSGATAEDAAVATAREFHRSRSVQPMIRYGAELIAQGYQYQPYAATVAAKGLNSATCRAIYEAHSMLKYRVDASDLEMRQAANGHIASLAKRYGINKTAVRSAYSRGAKLAKGDERRDLEAAGLVACRVVTAAKVAKVAKRD